MHWPKKSPSLLCISLKLEFYFLIAGNASPKSGNSKNLPLSSISHQPYSRLPQQVRNKQTDLDHQGMLTFHEKSIKNRLQ